jgi:hypothetical protein
MDGVDAIFGIQWWNMWARTLTAARRPWSGIHLRRKAPFCTECGSRWAEINILCFHHVYISLSGFAAVFPIVNRTQKCISVLTQTHLHPSLKSKICRRVLVPAEVSYARRTLPITVATQPKALNTAVVASNPTKSMAVSLSLFCLSCAVCRCRPRDDLIPHPRNPVDCA